MKKIFVFSLFAVFLFAGSAYADSYMGKGSRLYEKKDFKGAAENFLKARDKKPKDPVINYNLGAAYYKAGEFGKAAEAYGIALNNTDDINFKSGILYNMGNCAYRKGDGNAALDYYKAALKLNSKDIQAKHNIEIIQNEKNKNNKDDDKKDKNDKDKKQNKDEDKRQDGKDKNKDDKNKDKEDEKQKRKQPEEKNKQQEKNRYLLDYFDRQDKQNQSKKQNTAVPVNKGGKTW